MSATRGTVTFGSVEMRIRRDLLNDNDADQYRWSVAAAMSAMNQAVKDIALRMNSWAGYDEYGIRIYNLNTSEITTNCDNNPNCETLPSSTVSALRAITIPLSDRYAEAIAYIAAAKMLLTDDSDTANAQKAATYLEIGKEMAQA